MPEWSQYLQTKGEVFVCLAEDELMSVILPDFSSEQLFYWVQYEMP